MYHEKITFPLHLTRPELVAVLARSDASLTDLTADEVLDAVGRQLGWDRGAASAPPGKRLGWASDQVARLWPELLTHGWSE